MRPVDRQAAPLPGGPQPQRPARRLGCPSRRPRRAARARRCRRPTHGSPAPQARSHTAARNSVSICAKWASSTRPARAASRRADGILDGTPAGERVVGEPVHGGALAHPAVAPVAHHHPPGAAESTRPPSTGSQPIDSTRSRRGSSPVVSMSTASSRRSASGVSRPGQRHGQVVAQRAGRRRCAAPARAAARRCGGTGSRDVLHGVAVGQRRLGPPHDRERLAQVPLVEAATARRARRSCRSARRARTWPAWWRSRTYEMNSNASRRSSARSVTEDAGLAAPPRCGPGC